MGPWTRHLARAPLCLAWLLFALGFGAPLAVVAWDALRVSEVVRGDGTVLTAVGDVKESRGRVLFATQAGPGAPKEQQNLRRAADPARAAPSEVATVRTVPSLAHLRHVLLDPRTPGLLRNSVFVAGGGALLATLLGAALAFGLARLRLPGRGLLGVLLALPLVLPPFFVALGGARRWQGWIQAAFGAEGGTLQLLNSGVVFGLTLYPLALLLLGPALARLPAGQVEAARLLAGRRAAWRTVTWPAVAPALAAAFLVAFVLALTDFAVPDVTGFLLPAGGAPAHTYATEVFFQVKQEGSRGRAVATALPLLFATTALLVLALGLLRARRSGSAPSARWGPSGRAGSGARCGSRSWPGCSGSRSRPRCSASPPGRAAGARRRPPAARPAPPPRRPAASSSSRPRWTRRPTAANCATAGSRPARPRPSSHWRWPCPSCARPFAGGAWRARRR